VEKWFSIGSCLTRTWGPSQNGCEADDGVYELERAIVEEDRRAKKVLANLTEADGNRAHHQGEEGGAVLSTMDQRPVEREF